MLFYYINISEIPGELSRVNMNKYFITYLNVVIICEQVFFTLLFYNGHQILRALFYNIFLFKNNKVT